MKNIFTTDLSREGSACYIYESVSLIEQYGAYAVLQSRKTAGLNNAEIFLLISTTNYETAIEKYKEVGGLI